MDGVVAGGVSQPARKVSESRGCKDKSVCEYLPPGLSLQYQLYFASTSCLANKPE